MQLNGGTLHIRLNIEFNGQPRFLFNYNMCKHLNIRDIYMEDII